jgi:thiamine-phosphate pyrophosphorylase
MKLPRIYPITDQALSGLSHAEQVARLIDGGATLIQIRDKQSSPKAFLHDARAAKRIADQNNVKLIINDRVDIAMAIDAAGVHVGQSDLPVDVARRLLNENTIVGFSTHNLQQAELAVEASVDYLAFGPIFGTRTKVDRDPTVGLDLLSSAKRVVRDVPLVAIGGITAENCRAVLAAGADSVAVISAVVGEGPNISQNMRRLLDFTTE